MIKPNKIRKPGKGFTLLEVIITLIIAAILAGFLISFMGTALTKGGDPIKQTRDLGTSSGNMEKISADYASYLSNTISWDTFKQQCGNYGSCTTVQSGSAIYNANWETIQVTVTTGNQIIVSYFMQ
ncbi:MAG: hypothetical protein CVU61_01810 [Deltaproteobacteria bacterium HGW-Deltaproteobacteria-19]|jgi:prepilin-type N-terminal cleavage/methylation domain-containing protein|nr:MAG: hypothetical protein CVU61_01810 [Deltaproteobacteria bacterium HGW-Deltaproteobacteria-19]